MSDYVAELIAAAPPLDDERRARIAAILQGVTPNEQTDPIAA